MEEKLNQDTPPSVKATAGAPIPPNLKVAPKPIKWFRTALAIACLLLMVCMSICFYYYSQASKANRRAKEIELKHATLLQRNAALEASLDIVRHPGMQQVSLKSVADSSASIATIYWNQKTKELYLLADALEAPVDGKQYQLWAQVDGQWVDAGLVDWKVDGTVMKMHNVVKASAFAISLENTGGNTNTSEKNWLAIGKI
ncbi:MAG TPA: anti-sigma factor [Phnomibacter sp.]|nr:anti-sigma factor [Phnomibacter sp.]